MPKSLTLVNLSDSQIEAAVPLDAGRIYKALQLKTKPVYIADCHGIITGRWGKPMAAAKMLEIPTSGALP